MFKFVACATIVLLMTGCATNKEFRGPSGEVMHSVKCKSDESQCFNDAYTKCGGPYEVISGVRSTGGVFADVIPGPVIWYKVTYKCGAGKTDIPEFKNDGRSVVMPNFNIPQPQPKITPSTTNCFATGKSVTCNTY